MQQLAELEAQADRVEVRSSRKRKASARRKVTVRLSEGVCGRLDVATDRPGVGKSMLVEAALEHFLNAAPSVEALLHERFDDMRARFDHLERDMRMIAETVALHARYHLTVVPPVPQSRQREAVILGEERFRVLAELVDRRVRQGQPLMQETIDRLNSAKHEVSGPATAERPTPVYSDPSAASERVELEQTPPASTMTERGFAQHPKVTFGRTKPALDGRPNPRAAQNPDPTSSTAKLDASRETSLSKWRLILAVFLPFAAGYYLAYLFRTINASIAPALASDFGLDAAAMGLLASVYFLVFASAQIPIGVLLDRFGPRRVQSVLLVLAAGGASLYGTATAFPELLMGRALIGLGVAASLMAGMKVIVLWFPKERVALVNGLMIMLGALGAVTATAPTEWLLNYLGWRDLFEILTITSVATAGFVYLAVPERDATHKNSTISENLLTLRSIFCDPRFIRVAPLSATCIGSSWALQSLWAAPWLADVEGFDRQGVASQLFVMALGISLGALLLGMLADRLRRHGVRTEVALATVGVLFVLAQLALVLHLPLPSLLPWCIVSVMGAATVLSFAVIADYFPVELAARANGALNLLHFGWAFVVQCGIGMILAQWPPQDGHYPIEAYQSAFGVSFAFQAIALIWFASPWLRKLSGRLQISFSRAHEDADHTVELVVVSAEGTVMDASERVDW
jgi:MFS family permease